MKKEKRIKQNEKDFSELHAYVHFEILNKIEKKQVVQLLTSDKFIFTQEW